MATPGEKDRNRRGSLLALGAVVVIFVIGWIVIHELYASEKLENCLLSGRTNCAPVEAPNR